MRTRAGAVVMALLVLAVAAGGCTSVRNGLGRRESICFASLPAARQVVGKEATFAGVRYLSPVAVRKDLLRIEHHLTPLPAALSRLDHKAMCLVAYRGRFRRDIDSLVWRPRPGPYGFAIVVVRQTNQKVLGVLLLRRVAVRFAKLY